jgi:hypothetical protein
MNITTTSVIAAAMPTASALASRSAWVQFWSVPIAEATALMTAPSRTVTPTATSQPKKQAPQLMPP